MELIVLPVRKGDSFILKNEGKNYIIDGGISASAIVPMVRKELKNQSIEHIDINEIWLPSIFARSVRCLDEHSYLFDDELDYEEEIDEELLSEKGEYANEEELDSV